MARAGTTVDAGLRRQPAPLIPRGTPRPGRARPSARCYATLSSGDQRCLGTIIATIVAIGSLLAVLWGIVIHQNAEMNARIGASMDRAR